MRTTIRTRSLASLLLMVGLYAPATAALSVSHDPTTATPDIVGTGLVRSLPASDADSDAPRCAHHWRGHEDAIEEFLRTAPIERFADIPVGVTKPKRAYFAPGGRAGSMAWKPLPTGIVRGYAESYRSEIAAYRLSRLLDLHMVPPSVERKVGRITGAGIMWLDHVRPWDVQNPPTRTGPRWSYQVSRMKLFDQLIGNIDRNRGNLLVDEDGHLFLIDHSRAFVRNHSLNGLEGPSQVDRELWQRIDALTREELLAELTPWLTTFQIDAMLSRRDHMRVEIDEKVRTRGDVITFLP